MGKVRYFKQKSRLRIVVDEQILLALLAEKYFL